MVNKYMFELFDKIYVINLDRRKDRWEQVKKTLRSMKVWHKTVRIPGIDRKVGHKGCTLSHIKFLETILEDKPLFPLVLEDDACLFNDFNQHKSLITNAFCKLPYDWAIFYIGYNLDPYGGHKCPDFISPELIQLHGCFTTHAYSVNMELAPQILEKLKEQFNKTIQIDVCYGLLATRDGFKTYGIYPMLINQRPCFSDISNCPSNYTLRQNVDHVLRNHKKI